MRQSIFKGSAAALVTPMKPGGGLDFTALRRLTDRVLAGKTDAVVVNGTTGESATLSDREKLAVIEAVIKTVDGRVPVIAGTGSNCTRHAVELSKEAQRLGADALLQVTPYYNKATQEGLVRHFTAVGDSVDIPILLYNVPGRTGVSIRPETYQILSGHPNIRGTKEAGGRLIGACEDRCWMRGCSSIFIRAVTVLTLPVMALGGRGVISVLANLMPWEMHEMCRLFQEGRIEESRNLQLKLMGVMEAMFWEVNPIPVKAALSILGICDEFCRLPLTPMEREEKERLAEVLKSVSN